MELHGSLASNLEGALQSANRLRKERIYAGTLEHWQGLVDESYRRLSSGTVPDDAEVRKLVVELEAVLASRKVMGGRPS